MPEYKHPAVRIAIFLIALLGIITLYFHIMGYSTSIGWSLSTESEMEEIVAHQFQKGPFEFKLKGEKITLSESFYGEEIQDLNTIRIAAFLLIAFAISLIAACVTYLKRLGFLIFSVFIVLFLMQLQIDVYAAQDRWILLLPFVVLVGPAYYFHAYNSNATFLLRLAGITLGVAILVVFIPQGLTAFSLHFFANGIIPLLIIAFIFLALIAEEILFGLLHILTRTHGGKSNHSHMIILGGIYVANLLSYYLNKAGIFDFSFAFMNPYILMLISTGVAMWSLKFKQGLIGSFHIVPALVMILSFGLITYVLLSFGFAQGIDAIPESIHYLIIYTHLGFGFFFLVYIILNFIDPLAKGMMVHKVVYKPQSFHYVTARLAGLIAVTAFFFLSSKLVFKLGNSAQYSLKGDIERLAGEVNLALTYYETADFYGYNTHYPNYRSGSIYLNKQKQIESRGRFQKATIRFPSPQAFLNTSNLESSSDLSLAKTQLNTGLVEFGNHPELLNNLGIINWKNGLTEQAYEAFKDTESDQDWNQAPQANKWGALSALRSIKDERPTDDFDKGNMVVKTNILSALLSAGQRLDRPVDTTYISNSPFPLHRQAFLLNAMFTFSDSGLHDFTDRELSTPVMGIQPQLRKALALNLYLTGKVKSAFVLLDQIQTSKSGIKSGATLNEMGLLALDQNAPREARDFFTQAIDNGYNQARFNRLVAFLEAGDFKNAEIQLDELIQSDSVYAPLKNSLVNVFKSGTDPNLEAQFNELYFRASELSPVQFQGALAKFDKAGRQMIMNRMMSLAENQSFDPAAYGLESPDLTDLDTTNLVSLAKERPFDERIVLMAADHLAKKEVVDAYTLLIESLEFNPYSIPLLKAFAMSAIDINLPDYAQETMITLSNLMSPVQYLAFEKAWYTKKAENEDSWPY